MQNKQQQILRKLIREYGIETHSTWYTYQELPLKIPDLLDAFVFSKKVSPQDALGDPNFVALLQACYVTYATLKAGDPIFTIKKDLAIALRDTEIPNISVEEIKLPFEGINIDFPENTLNAPANNASRYIVALTPVEQRLRIISMHGEYTNFINMDLIPGKKLWECIDETTRKTWENCNNPEIRARFEETSVYKDYYKSDMFRLAMNTILYITSPEADVQNTHNQEIKNLNKKMINKKGLRREEYSKRIKMLNSQKNYIVGAKFRLSKEYTAKLTSEGKKWELKHRVRVMGHFKNQPVGPGRLERKRIWIAPYWKGPTMAELIQKKYVVR